MLLRHLLKGLELLEIALVLALSFVRHVAALLCWLLVVIRMAVVHRGASVLGLHVVVL